MLRNRKLLLLITSVITASTILSGCKAKTKTEPASISGEKQPPTKISILSIFYSQEPVPKDNAVLKELEKRTNTELDIQWVSSNAFEEKITAMSATGDLPDYTRINSFMGTQNVKMAREGAFWDITPYIKNYKNLMALDQDLWKYSKIDGKNYGIPKSNFIYGGTFINYRVDWLKNLGLKTPQTMDELYNVLKAYTKNDPDKNGKEDTIGLTMNKDHVYFLEDVFNESSGGWKLVNGKVEGTITMPGTRKALEWLQNAYKEGIIPKDLASMNGGQVNDLIRGNKAGAQINTMNESTTTEFNAKKIDPNAECWTLPYLIGGNGNKIYPKNSAYFGVFVIPKRTVKEDKLKKILEFADYGWSPEGAVLCKWGVENEHHTKDGDLYIKTEKGLKDPFGNLDNLFQPASKYGRAAGGTGVTKERYQKLTAVIDEQIKYGVDNISQNLISDTNILYGPDMGKQSNDLKIQVIMGHKTLADWDAYVNKLKNDPNYQKIVKEMDESYKKNK
jgi:putative aldouronate transport system substrate-binding protein